MKHLRCRDAGFDCDHEIQADTVDEVLQQAAEHVPSVPHPEETPERAEQGRGLIYDEE